MKKLFFVLLFVNVAYFLWNFMIDPAAFHRTATGRDVISEQGVESIVLLQELPDSTKSTGRKRLQTNVVQPAPNQGMNTVDSESSPSVESIDGIRSDQPTKIEIPDPRATPSGDQESQVAETDFKAIHNPTKSCYELGPFSDSQAVDAVVSELSSNSPWHKVHSRPADVQTGFWVVYPPAETLENSKVNVTMLRSRGIKDLWLFTEGKMRGSISLGLFETKERASKLVATLKKRDIHVELRPWLKQMERLWLQLHWNDTRILLEKRFEKFADKNSEVKISIVRSCKPDDTT